MSDVVDDHVRDGRRVAELLASELDGREDPPFGRVAVTDADRDVEPSPDGDRAYDISHDDVVIGRVYLQANRVRVELFTGLREAREVLSDPDIRWRAIGGERPRLLMFIADGVAVQRVMPVIGAAAETRDAG